MGFPVIDLTQIFNIGSRVAVATAKWVATRALLVSLCVTAVPYAIFQGSMMITEKVMETASASAPAGGFMTGQVIELAGLGAWVAVHIQLPAAFSIFMAALSLKFTLSFLRR